MKTEKLTRKEMREIAASAVRHEAKRFGGIVTEREAWGILDEICRREEAIAGRFYATASDRDYRMLMSLLRKWEVVS